MVGLSSSAAEPAPGGSLWRVPGLRGLVWLSVLAFLSFFLLLSALPLWAVAGGASNGAAGLVTTVMLVCTVAIQSVVPALVRQFGLAPALSAGLIALGGPAPFYLLHHDLWWLLVVSGLRGSGFAVVTVLLPILATRIAPGGRHGEAIGIYGLAIAIPNLLAVPGGVALTSNGHFEIVAILAGSPLLALPFVRTVCRPGRDHRPESGPGSGPGAARTLARISGVAIVLLSVTLAGGGLLTFLPIERPVGALATAALLLFGISSAFSRWRTGVLADRLGHRVLMPFGIAAAVAGVLLVAGGLGGQGPGADTLILVGAAMAGVGYGTVQNMTLLVAFALAGPAQRTTASAAWNAAFDAGTALGALLVGAVAAGGLGLAWTFVGCAALIALTTPLAMAATSPRRPS